MPNKPAIHTTVKDGKWTNIREGASRGSTRYDTKAAAQAAGRAAARRDKVEHIIHKKDGTIGERHSYGNDPHPPKG